MERKRNKKAFPQLFDQVPAEYVVQDIQTSWEGQLRAQAAAGVQIQSFHLKQQIRPL